MGIAWESPHETLPIFNATPMVFIPNFTATHDITSAYNVHILVSTFVANYKVS